MNAPLEDLQARLGHRFRDPAILAEALTHPSYLQDRPEARRHNQRLEFLGDAVLGLVLTDALFRLYPDEREGVLTRRRATLSQGGCLTEIGRALGLPPFLRLSASEESTGGRDRSGALEDAVEAVIGAIYLDGGLEAAAKAVLSWFGDLPARLALAEDQQNPKGRLQEWAQPRYGNDSLRYETVATHGPDHERRFEVEVYLLTEPLGRGQGLSKKLAEEAAARAALENVARSPSFGSGAS